MASHARLVLEDLVEAIAGSTGDYDLSTVDDTPRVVVADGGRPPVGPPFVAIAGPSVKSSDDGAMTEVGKEGFFQLFCFAPTTELSTQSRCFAALDLGEQVINAIEDAHADPAFTALFRLTVLLCDHDEPFADGPDVPDGDAFIRVTIRYTTDRPRGG
jgi:hypothetical protein